MTVFLFFFLPVSDLSTIARPAIDFVITCLISNPPPPLFFLSLSIYVLTLFFFERQRCPSAGNHFRFQSSDRNFVLNKKTKKKVIDVIKAHIKKKQKKKIDGVYIKKKTHIASSDEEMLFPPLMPDEFLLFTRPRCFVGRIVRYFILFFIFSFSLSKLSCVCYRHSWAHVTERK